MNEQTNKRTNGLPPEGIFIGSGAIDHAPGLVMSGANFTKWHPNGPRIRDIVDLCVRDRVGNTLQFWWRDGEEVLELARAAAAAGLYATFIYCDAPSEVAGRLIPELGERYLGYDYGEHFSPSCYRKSDIEGMTLRELAKDYMDRVAAFVRERKEAGWGKIMATSANFSLDYEVAAGTDIPCIEDYPFGDLMLASALSRGLVRQYGLPMWGSHLAHEWFCWLPFRNPWRMKSLETAFLLKYMAGAKLVINECGNWAQRSTLCEDSPMAQMPILVGDPPGLYRHGDPRSGVTPEIEAEALRRSPYIDYRSPVAKKYRQIIADFTAFCREHPAPKGQPEATIALAKGNLDLGSSMHAAGAAVCHAYDLAEKDPNWYSGEPERSWETVRAALLPQPPVFKPNKNIHFSGTPYGLVDIASFACDNITTEHLLRNYRALLFSGWNTCSPEQYRVLCDYVRGGGRLVIGLCHLSTDEKRNYNNFGPADLVNGGDFSDLCGVRVKGKTRRFYWATGTSPTPNCLGIAARRRFGYMMLPLGDLEYTNPASDYEPLAVDDETLRPFILRCRSGKGEVFLMNWWAYPSAANDDVGVGAEEDGPGLVERLYRYVAKISRGHVYITGPDFENPDADCDYIVCSYFPDEGKVYLLNLDYVNERKCVLQQFGDKDFITLAPAELRIVDSVVLASNEKFNEV